MIDLLDRLLTPCPPHLREMGYKHELFGIRRRWRQWGAAWRPHCDDTRGVILSAVRRCRSRRKAVVFGSGFLHDVPLDELCAAFGEVVLVDLLHPFSTKWRTRKRNVRLVSADVSETALAVWQAVERPGTPLPVSVPSPSLTEGADYVASVNLLSQLPCMPGQYLRRCGTHPAEEVSAYCRGVVEAHLAYLVRLPGVASLIADVEARTVDRAGAILERRSTLYGAALPCDGRRWVWPLLPRRDRPPHHGEHLLVVGVEDVKG